MNKRQKEWNKEVSAAKEYIEKFEIVSSGDTIKADEVNILSPEPQKPNEGNDNETCIIMEVAYKQFSTLLTADAEKNEMLKIKGDYDILKLPHHGSVESFSDQLFNNMKIGYGIVSVGKNSFGHPSKEVLKSFMENGIEVFRTDEKGDITVLSDGLKYWINFK
jgi:competence protein ComEC